MNFSVMGAELTALHGGYGWIVGIAILLSMGHLITVELPGHSRVPSSRQLDVELVNSL